MIIIFSLLTLPYLILQQELAHELAICSHEHLVRRKELILLKGNIYFFQVNVFPAEKLTIVFVGSLNCAAFVAGIVEAVLVGSDFVS